MFEVFIRGLGLRVFWVFRVWGDWFSWLKDFDLALGFAQQTGWVGTISPKP